MQELLLQINDLYGINGETSDRVTEGFLSENHIIFDGDIKYFLKKYRFNTAERIKEIHGAKKYFADHDIPVILPILDKNDNTFFIFENGYYALFPFMSERQIKGANLSETSVCSLGKMLGKIHLVGKDAAIPVSEHFHAWNKNELLIKGDNLIKTLQAKEKLNDFDKLALEDIQFRRSLIDLNPITFKSLDLPNNHLIHGDYHEGNIFFDAQDNVSHVFDFEKVAYAPRTFELARSLMFIFVDRDFENVPINKARLYLKTYMKIYPISKEEIRTGFTLYYLRVLHGFWVQNEHYKNNNFRVDQFLPIRFNSIKYLAEHLGELKKAIID